MYFPNLCPVLSQLDYVIIPPFHLLLLNWKIFYEGLSTLLLVETWWGPLKSGTRSCQMFCFDRSEVGINKKFQVTLSCSLTLAHLQPPPNKTALDTVESTDTQMKWEWCSLNLVHHTIKFNQIDWHSNPVTFADIMLLVWFIEFKFLPSLLMVKSDFFTFSELFRLCGLRIVKISNHED